MSASRNTILIAALLGWTFWQNWSVLPDRYAIRTPLYVIHREPLPLIVRAPGDLQAKRSFTLKAAFDGPVLAKNFQEGQSVHAQQLLLKIGKDKIQADYTTKKTTLANSRADMTRAQKDLKIQKSLYARQAVAYSAVEEAQRTLERATQDLAAAQESFRAEADLWNTNNLIAPFDGTIVKDALQNDHDVITGREILTLADLSEYIITARVDELDLGQIQVGQSARVSLQAFGEESLSAHVSRMGAQLDGNSLRQVPVVLLIDSLEGLPVLPNMTADVRIVVGTSEPALSVPLSAIDNSDGNPSVWVVSSSHHLHRQRVTLGRSNPDQVEVVNGLNEGTQICRTADPQWADGQLVKGHE